MEAAPALIFRETQYCCSFPANYINKKSPALLPEMDNYLTEIDYLPKRILPFG
jgi:hypothetical protein